MAKDGYQVVDFNDTEITVGGAAVAVPGSFDAVKNPYRKMTVLSRLNIGGVKQPDFPAKFKLSGADYVSVIDVVYTNATSAVAQIMTVTATDTVAITAATITSGV